MRIQRRGGCSVRRAFSPDGKRLAACGYKGIRIWDVASRETQAAWPSDSKVGSCLAFSPDGKRLATVSFEGMVELWDTAGGQKIQSFKGHFGRRPRRWPSSPDGYGLATGGADGTLRPLGRDRGGGTAFRSPGDGVDIRDPNGAGSVRTARPLLTGSSTRGERGPSGSGTPRRAIRAGPIELRQAVCHLQAWTADGKRLYIADSGKTVSVVDVASGKVVRTFPVDAEAKRYGIALSPDERWCAHPRARMARSRCGMARPAPYTARSGDSTGTYWSWRSARTARGYSEPFKVRGGSRSGRSQPGTRSRRPR